MDTIPCSWYQRTACPPGQGSSMQTIPCHTTVCRPDSFYTRPFFLRPTITALLPSPPILEFSLLKCQWKPNFIIEASVRCQKQSTHRSEKYSILINGFLLFPPYHITCQIFQPTTQALSTEIHGCQLYFIIHEWVTDMSETPYVIKG